MNFYSFLFLYKILFLYQLSYIIIFIVWLVSRGCLGYTIYVKKYLDKVSNI